MSEEGRNVAGKRYTYRRVVAEILTCETCQCTFLTQIPSGRGAFLSPSDTTVPCPACTEICSELLIDEQKITPPS